jgi:hypothetical protein
MTSVLGMFMAINGSDVPEPSSEKVILYEK